MAPLASQSEHLGERNNEGHHYQSDDASSFQTRHHRHLHAREFRQGTRCPARLYGSVAQDEASLGVNPMIPSGWYRAGNLVSRRTSQTQVAVLHKLKMVGAIGFEPMTSTV